MSVLDSITSIFVPIHREGHRFIALFAGVSVLLLWLAPPLGWIGVAMTGWCAYFFRDPDRHTPVRDGLVISPADGTVQDIVLVVPPPELDMGEEPCQRISIFMNVFNVHVNRAPVEGTISRKVYTPGKFVNASLDKASEDNERMAYRITLADGRDIGMVQIAGLVARRIVSFVDDHDPVKAGQRIGIIRFGSRVDIYLRDGQVPLVAPGQITVAGETVIADDQASEVQRWAEVR